MRTDAEILARIQERSHIDFFAWEANDLIVRLPFEAAKPLLKEDAKPDEWTVKPREREAVLAEMLDYMPFAWGKANDQRGISAGARCLGVARAGSTAVNRFARRYLGFVSLRASVRPSNITGKSHFTNFGRCVNFPPASSPPSPSPPALRRGSPRLSGLFYSPPAHHRVGFFFGVEHEPFCSFGHW